MDLELEYRKICSFNPPTIHPTTMTKDAAGNREERKRMGKEGIKNETESVLHINHRKSHFIISLEDPFIFIIHLIRSLVLSFVAYSRD